MRGLLGTYNGIILCINRRCFSEQWLFHVYILSVREEKNKKKETEKKKKRNREREREREKILRNF